MKIIALLPVKNEAWVLPSYLSSVGCIADCVIALDDGSTDSSSEILRAAGATVLSYKNDVEEIVQMSTRRQVLLEAGRSAGGTHFIWLDADETFSSNFILEAREVIATLQPGQKMTMRWVHAWKGATEYLCDERSPFGYIWKDFIVCDDGVSIFDSLFLSEARTVGNYGEPLRVNDTTGVVLHWQFSAFELMQWKQAWYRATELIEGSRSARRINHTYAITKDNPTFKLKTIPGNWTKNIILPTEVKNGTQYKAALAAFFNAYSIEFFEGLDIWDIPELREEFVKKTDREPKVQSFPPFIVWLNSLKNNLRTYGQKN